MFQQACAARHFLNTWMEAHGRWMDFSIPTPGISDQWVSAYTGLCILESRLVPDTRTQASIERVCQFLHESQRTGGGWGYNARTTGDTDSTAHALLCLRTARHAAGKEAYGFLLDAQMSDGGFATYYPDGIRNGSGWSVSHVDVSACAVLALYGVTFKDHHILLHARDYLEGILAENPLPPAYWWSSAYYTALVCLKAFRVYGWRYPEALTLQEVLSREVPTLAFDKALRLELIARLGGETESSVQDLLACQRADGSFSGGRILRVTHPQVLHPWEGTDTGDMVEDENALFTTATVLRALGCVMEVNNG